MTWQATSAVWSCFRDPFTDIDGGNAKSHLFLGLYIGNLPPKSPLRRSVFVFCKSTNRKKIIHWIDSYFDRPWQWFLHAFWLNNAADNSLVNRRHGRQKFQPMRAHQKATSHCSVFRRQPCHWTTAVRETDFHNRANRDIFSLGIHAKTVSARLPICLE